MVAEKVTKENGYIENSQNPDSKDKSQFRDNKDIQRNFRHEEKILDKQQKYDLEKFRIGLGRLGRFFGHEDNSSKNITFVILIVLVVIVSVLTWCFFENNQLSEFVKLLWTQLFPIITLSLGYLFGKK